MIAPILTFSFDMIEMSRVKDLRFREPEKSVIQEGGPLNTRLGTVLTTFRCSSGSEVDEIIQSECNHVSHSQPKGPACVTADANRLVRTFPFSQQLVDPYATRR